MDGLLAQFKVPEPQPVIPPSAPRGLQLALEAQLEAERGLKKAVDLEYRVEKQLAKAAGQLSPDIEASFKDKVGAAISPFKYR